MKVYKFGGTSVGTPDRMKHVAELITTDNEKKIIVLSAVSGTTNALVEIGDLFQLGNVDGALSQFLWESPRWTNKITRTFQGGFDEEAPI